MRDYGQQKVLEYAVQMNGKKSVFQSVCRQNLEMNGHFWKSGVKWIFSVEGEDLPQEEGPSIWHSAPKTGLRDPSAAVPIGIAVTGAFLFLTAGRSERRKE